MTYLVFGLTGNKQKFVADELLGTTSELPNWASDTFFLIEQNVACTRQIMHGKDRPMVVLYSSAFLESQPVVAYFKAGTKS